MWASRTGGANDYGARSLVASALDCERERIARLARMLGLDPEVRATVWRLRYQLLHRTAAVLFDAARWRTLEAVMLVETFSAEDAHWGDFAAFVRAVGGVAEKGRLWVGWCNSTERD